MILGIIVFIFTCAGIYGFYNDIYTLTYIGFILTLIEGILGRISGTLKSMLTTIIAGIIGSIIVQDFWLGIAIGVCFENVIMAIGGWLMIFIGSIIASNLDNENNSNDSNIENDESAREIMQQTIDNARRDLETGIKKEQLDEMLENGYITQEVYDETLMNIKKLEMISNFDINKLNNIIDTSNNDENNSNDEYNEDLEDLINNDDEND